MLENNDNKIVRFGYEDLKKDLELEIFGLKFNIGVNESYLKKISEFQAKASNYKDNDYKLVEDFMDELLGAGAYKQISDKYEQDQGVKIDVFVWVKVVMFIYNELQRYFDKYNNTFRPRNRVARRSNIYGNNMYRNNYRRNRRY